MLIVVPVCGVHDIQIQRGVARVHRCIGEAKTNNITLVDTLDALEEFINTERDVHRLLAVIFTVLLEILAKHPQVDNHNFCVVVLLQLDAIVTDHEHTLADNVFCCLE